MEVLYSKPRHVALSNDRDLYSGADNTSSNTHIKTNTRTHTDKCILHLHTAMIVLKEQCLASMEKVYHICALPGYLL